MWDYFSWKPGQGVWEDVTFELALESGGIWTFKDVVTKVLQVERTIQTKAQNYWDSKGHILT